MDYKICKKLSYMGKWYYFCKALDKKLNENYST